MNMGPGLGKRMHGAAAIKGSGMDDFCLVGTALAPRMGMRWSMICFGSASHELPSSMAARNRLIGPIRVSGNSSVPPAALERPSPPTTRSGHPQSAFPKRVQTQPIPEWPRRTLFPVSSFRFLAHVTPGGGLCVTIHQGARWIMTVQGLQGYEATTQCTSPTAATAFPPSLLLRRAFCSQHLQRICGKRLRVGDPEYNITTHRLIQTTSFSYGQGMNSGDPA